MSHVSHSEGAGSASSSNPNDPSWIISEASGARDLGKELWEGAEGWGRGNQVVQVERLSVKLVRSDAAQVGARVVEKRAHEERSVSP